jgi:hypothetical protein
VAPVKPSVPKSKAADELTETIWRSPKPENCVDLLHVEDFVEDEWRIDWFQID